MTPVHEDHRLDSHGTRRKVFVVEHPMPASQADIDNLKGLLKWAKTTRSGAAKEQALIDTLEQAIKYLEEPDSRRNILMFLLAALRQSVRKSEKTHVWYVVDHVMYDWAMHQLQDIFIH